MTQQEITEGSKLIARFASGRWVSVDECIATGPKDSADTVYTPVADLKYHADYNRLMPVWVKFCDLKVSDKDKVAHFNYKGQIETAMMREDILVAFSSICDAIKWYNDNINSKS